MNFIELERPHGFLVWKGKQTAVAADEPLPVGEPVLIVSDGEAFGVATLAQPAQMKAAEFDGKSWQAAHRVYPEERRRYWPDATAFYVHRIESFEGYQKAKLFDGEKAIDYEPTDAEKALMDQSRRLPKQIIINPDAVILDGGKFSLCDGITCDGLTAALQATYEAEPEYGDGDGDKALTLYKLALVREPRMVVKKKSPPMTGESPKAAEEPEHEEPMKAQATKEQSIDQLLTFIRQQFNDEFMPDDEMYMDLWAREIFDTFLVAEEEGRLFRVAYMLVGESEVVFSPRPAWVEVEVNYAPKGFTKLGEFKREKIVKIETKGGFIDKIKAARDALAALLMPPGGEVKVTPIFTEQTGVIIKEVDGEPWHFAWSTNAFQDREGELFSTKALEYYVSENEKRDDKGYFDFWHIPGTDFARKEWQGVVGRFLVEAGPYLDNEAGRKALSFFKQHPTGHPEIAPEGWGSSPEFVYLPEQRATGVYEWVHITRTSTLPKAAAANVYTEAKQERIIMALSPHQKEAATALFGEEFVKRLETEGAKRTEQLEAAGVAFKGETETVTENTVNVTETVEPVETDDQPDPEAVETEEAAPETVTNLDLPVIEIDIEAIGAEVAKQFQADLSPFMDALGQIAGEFKGLSDRVGKLEKAADVKEQTETPRFWVQLKRASEAEETVIDSTSDLKGKQPKQTQHVDGSPAGHYFTKK